ncbi:MAG: hypothetical protein QM632_02875 [Micrococcaceae bacterium]
MEKRLVPLKEWCLEYSLPYSTVRNWVVAGGTGIPVLKLKGRYYCRPHLMEQWLAKQEVTNS